MGSPWRVVDRVTPTHVYNKTVYYHRLKCPCCWWHGSIATATDEPPPGPFSCGNPDCPCHAPADRGEGEQDG